VRIFSPDISNIKNYIKKDALEEENEIPQIKEICLEVIGTSLESPVPQVPSIPVVSSISHTYDIYILSHSISQSQSAIVNTRRILGSPSISQPGLLGFISIGTIRPRMDRNKGGSIARHP
jgi:hypothetical protein